MWKAQNWTEYELLDTSDGERLERWGKYTLVRPDPQVIWKNVKGHKLWTKADAIYKRSSKGGGAWGKNNLPEHWTMNYDHLGLTFRIKPTGFKHTGLFPEQAANWDWFSDLIKKAGRPIKVLNLFAYTGGATVAAAKAGASVTHVDASKGMVAEAKLNASLSGLGDAPIRYDHNGSPVLRQRPVGRGMEAGGFDFRISDPCRKGALRRSALLPYQLVHHRTFGVDYGISACPDDERTLSRKGRVRRIGTGGILYRRGSSLRRGVQMDKLNVIYPKP